MGPRHDAATMLAAAVEVARERGLAAVTFQSVAARIGATDRMVVYYFPSKRHLLDAVVAALGAQLQAVLDEAFGDEPLPPDQLLARAWPVLATPEADPVFRLLFEVVGAAAARQPGYEELAPVQMRAWVEWLQDRIDLPGSEQRLAAACSIIARIDGALMLRQILGPRFADHAARDLGFA